MSSKEENPTSVDTSALPNDNDDTAKSEDLPDSELQESSETDETAIDKGPYGVVAILSLDGNILRSLGINPDHVTEIRYRPYNGAILVEPVTA
ncbi:hypothetical protein [Halorubrum sp. Eb13]|uniref:hypothetical protein n=1 Tax=Halorubrum sp. Eb13 TaxID=1383843 RepID=UPI000B980ACE|nr:hypothetical protein [Halorubrum sp. Eb13]OYR42893.1 hypothetical protein DJ75_12410 [Halorubrum sp. Eb13]